MRWNVLSFMQNTLELVFTGWQNPLKSEFHKVMELKENKIFSVISPIVYPSVKRGMVE